MIPEQLTLRYVFEQVKNDNGVLRKFGCDVLIRDNFISTNIDRYLITYVSLNCDPVSKSKHEPVTQGEDIGIFHKPTPDNPEWNTPTTPLPREYQNTLES